jgi:hypothetical protein
MKKARTEAFTLGGNMDRLAGFIVKQRTVVFALVTGLMPLSICVAQQQVPDVVVLEWVNVNGVCEASQRNAETSRQCERRDKLTVALREKGYVLINSDVWISPEQRHYFGSVVLKAGLEAGANPGLSESIMQGMLSELHSKMKDEQIISLWNDPALREALERQSPHGYPLIYKLVHELARQYSNSNNPALTLEGE